MKQYIKRWFCVSVFALAALIAVPAQAATIAAVIQLDGTETTGPNALINVHFYIIDSTAQLSKKCVATDLSLPVDSPGTWKTTITSAVVTEAANVVTCGNFTVTQANVRYLSYEPGDYNYVDTKLVWTKDATKLNLPTTNTNVYAGNAGEPQLINFAGMSQYRFVVSVNKVSVGASTITSLLSDVNNAANVIEIADAAAIGEKTLDSGWTNLPAWATGEKVLKPMARTTLNSDDPVYHGFLLYVR